MAAKRARRAASAAASAPRDNQRLRTRQELLRAAARLIKAGKQPLTLDDVAAEALISRATIYRYFTNIEALLVEAPLDEEVPQPAALFADDESGDAAERVDRAEAALHAMVYANQAQLRTLLANSLRADRDAAGPLRQNRRLPLIETALAPHRARLDDATYERLCASLALVFGVESMVVLTDVLPKSEKDARAIKSWVVRTLVDAALAESTAKKPVHRARGKSAR